MIDGFCRGCKFLGTITSGYCCDYMSVMGARRGCKAGKGCTRRKPGGKAVSLAALHVIGRLQQRQHEPVRKRETWEEIYEKERQRKVNQSAACKARCAGRQKTVIEAWLKQNHVTKKHLGEMIGVSASTVGKWCAERGPARWDLLAQVGIEKPEGL